MMEKLDVFFLSDSPFKFGTFDIFPVFLSFVSECKKLRLVSATTFIGFNTAKNEPSNADTFTAKNV